MYVKRWVRTEQCTGLVDELTPEMVLGPLDVQKGGISPGTYVCKELVYAYAMWISPSLSNRLHNEEAIELTQFISLLKYFEETVDLSHVKV